MTRCIPAIHDDRDGTTSDSPAALKKLGGDADGDFRRVIAADRETDRAEDSREHLLAQAILAEVSEQGGALGCAADHTEKGTFRKAPENFGNDRPVMGMALRDAKHEALRTELCHAVGQRSDAVEPDIFMVRKSRQPVGPRIEDIQSASERG